MPEVKYGKAMKRLQEIIAAIEDEQIDVDELSVKVKEAVGLIKMCKEKIEQAETEVTQVVKDLEVNGD